MSFTNEETKNGCTLISQTILSKKTDCASTYQKLFVKQTLCYVRQRQESFCHLLKDVLVIYVFEHCDEARQLVFHFVLRHSLCRLFQQIVTVFSQLHGDTRRDMTSSGHCVSHCMCVNACVCERVLTSSGALQMDFGSLKFTTDVRA